MEHTNNIEHGNGGSFSMTKKSAQIAGAFEDSGVADSSYALGQENNPIGAPQKLSLSE